MRAECLAGDISCSVERGLGVEQVIDEIDLYVIPVVEQNEANGDKFNGFGSIAELGGEVQLFGDRVYTPINKLEEKVIA